ncbi:MAG TPA: ABC transporter substrate-binding protein [Candidatus Limnocylindria bacterium]|nr:ABC transporter substrate-binding protein [Candidatus Limnocylindria bacterium]
MPGRRDLVTRRELLERTLGTAAALGGSGLIAACGPTGGPIGAPSPGATLPPPETTTVRFVSPPVCDPPAALAKAFLLEEGFTDVQYVRVAPTSTGWLTSGVAEFNSGGYGSQIAVTVDGGLPLVALAGIHPGCLELFAVPGISTIGDLRGKTIAVNAKNASDLSYAFFSVLLAHIGINATDVNFIEIGPDVPALRDAFVDGRSEAFIAPAAFGPQLRRNPKNPGKVILDTTVDKPWSQYYCCQLVANRDWARRYPIATKRVTRAVLRAADLVTKDRASAAHEYVAGGFFSTTPGATDEDIVKEVIRDLSYDWRELDPEETLRFFALRLADAKLVKGTSQQIIAQGSDFAYMRQLRTELKH